MLKEITDMKNAGKNTSTVVGQLLQEIFIGNEFCWFFCHLTKSWKLFNKKTLLITKEHTCSEMALYK